MTDIFLHPRALYLLVLLPLAALMLVLAEYKRRRALALLLNSDLAQKLTNRWRRVERAISSSCLLAAGLFIILALARPIWGTHFETAPETGRNLLFIVDVSQSMLAKDQPPNRLKYAKTSIMQCLDSLTTSRVGLLAFAGSPSIKCPLTRDYGFFRTALNDLQPDSVPIGGTRLGDALNKSIDRILANEKPESCDVIVITDGESHTPINTNAVKRLAENKINLILLGIGSDTTPAAVPTINPKTGKEENLTYHGKTVYSRQNSERLKKIAAMVPDSVYINVGTNPMNLAEIYRKHTESIAKSRDTQRSIERPIERYRPFLLLALAFITASFLPHIYTTRTSSPTQPHPVKKRIRHNYLISAALMATCLLGSTPALAKSRHALFRDGLDNYKAGNFADSAADFTAAEQKKPDPVISYNIGVASYRNGDYARALFSFSQAANATSDEKLAVDSVYNMGNTYFMAAIHTPGISAKDAINNARHAVAAFQSVVERRPNHKDAQFNLKAARKLLDTMLSAASKQQNKQDQNGDDNQDMDQDSQEDDSTDSDKATSDDSKQNPDDEETSPPNLTPDDILREENKNKLKRSRKKHADFGKVEMNW